LGIGHRARGDGTLGLVGSMIGTMTDRESVQLDGQSDAGEVDLPLVNEDGVDLTLIRWSLRLTPLERLRVLQGHMDLANRMRDAWKLSAR
jgi:hypothetical protein